MVDVEDSVEPSTVDSSLPEVSLVSVVSEESVSVSVVELLLQADSISTHSELMQ